MKHPFNIRNILVIIFVNPVGSETFSWSLDSDKIISYPDPATTDPKWIWNKTTLTSW